jgi:hypothetical protein
VTGVGAGPVVVSPDTDRRGPDGRDPLDEEPGGQPGIRHHHELAGTEAADGNDDEAVPRSEGGLHAVAGHHHPLEAAATRDSGDRGDGGDRG